MNRAVVWVSMLLAGVANAGTITNTFNLPSGPINADGVTALGVTFHFSDSSALYGFDIGIPLLTDPVLEGPASGTLTLEFLQAVTSLSFDFVVGPVSGAVSPGVTVALSGPDFAGSSPQIASTGQPDNTLALGAFSYSGGSPFTQALITFSSAAQLFAIDNLVYNQVDPGGSPTTIPEPGTVVLAGSAILLALHLKRRLSLAR